MKVAQLLASGWVDIIIMYYVYLLQDNEGKLYIGFTTILKEGLENTI